MPIKKLLLCLSVALLCGFALTAVTNAQETSNPYEMQGWANVPGGQVWLEPGVHAYEHDSGLVRDTRTGKHYRPITPQDANATTRYQPSPQVTQANANCPCNRPHTQPMINPYWKPAPIRTPQDLFPRINLFPRIGDYYDYGPYGSAGDTGGGFQYGAKPSLSEKYQTIDGLR